MLRVRVREARPGMRLARPVPQPDRPTRYLLQRDYLLDSSSLNRLVQVGIEEIWVHCEELGFLEELVDEELHERQRELYGNIRQNFERVMRLANAELNFDVFQNSVSNLFNYLNSHSRGFMFIDKVQLFDEYLMAHSTNVCYLALLLGMKLDWYLLRERANVSPREAKDVVHLGMGCLLHDVGKLRIPKEILNKPGRLTDDEMARMRTHPILGYQMVKGKVPVATSQVVLNHHQRWDGGGYPAPGELNKRLEGMRLEGRQIHIFARIATIADVFDAATSKRCYSGAKPSVQVLSEILRYNRGFFDPVIAQAFFEIVPPFPIGSLATLNNGLEAAIVDFDPSEPCRPTVRPIRYPDGQPCVYPDTIEINLAQTPELFIEKVGDQDVTSFLFETREYPWSAEKSPRAESFASPDGIRAAASARTFSN